MSSERNHRHAAHGRGGDRGQVCVALNHLGLDDPLHGHDHAIAGGEGSVRPFAQGRRQQRVPEPVGAWSVNEGQIRDQRCDLHPFAIGPRTHVRPIVGRDRAAVQAANRQVGQAARGGLESSDQAEHRPVLDRHGARGNCPLGGARRRRGGVRVAHEGGDESLGEPLGQQRDGGSRGEQVHDGEPRIATTELSNQLGDRGRRAVVGVGEVQGHPRPDGAPHRFAKGHHFFDADRGSVERSRPVRACPRFSHRRTPGSVARPPRGRHRPLCGPDAAGRHPPVAAGIGPRSTRIDRGDLRR